MVCAIFAQIIPLRTARRTFGCAGIKTTTDENKCEHTIKTILCCEIKWACTMYCRAPKLSCGQATGPPPMWLSRPQHPHKKGRDLNAHTPRGRERQPREHREPRENICPGPASLCGRRLCPVRFYVGEVFVGPLVFFLMSPKADRDRTALPSCAKTRPAREQSTR